MNRVGFLPGDPAYERFLPSASCSLWPASPGWFPPRNRTGWTKRREYLGQAQPDQGRPSPGMGYETSLGLRPASASGHPLGRPQPGRRRRAERRDLDPRPRAPGDGHSRSRTRSPPGVCCAQQNVFDPVGGRFLRFPAFSGSHGWQWFRENYLNNSSVWSLRPRHQHLARSAAGARAALSPLRCASWDGDTGWPSSSAARATRRAPLVYDPYTNTWTPHDRPSQPAFRSGGNLAYDAARKLHILFGTQFSDDPHTWAYDLRANDWRDLKPDRQPPTDRNDAVLAYDSQQRVVIAVVRVVDRRGARRSLGGHLETWAFDAGKNTWTQMNPPREPDGWGNRRRVLAAVPDQNVSCWSLRQSDRARARGRARAANLDLSLMAKGKRGWGRDGSPTFAWTRARKRSTLEWGRRPAGKEMAYVVYRGEGAKPWQAELRAVGRVEKGKNTFDDRQVKTGTDLPLVAAGDRRRRAESPAGIQRAHPARASWKM